MENLNAVQQENVERVTMLRTKVAEAVRAYGALRAAAKIAISHYGIQWIKPTAGDKTGQADRKELRNIVTGEAERGGHSNPRKVWSDFSKYAREEAGLEKVTNTKTAYDRVKAALGSIRANINDCEYSAVRDIADMWPEIESAAISAGLLKAVE
jgi:hypothetical protein